MASVPVPRRSPVCAPCDSSRPYHPPTLTMVLEAVRELDQPKGVSAFAIKRYILHEYPAVDPVKLKYYLKTALVKGINQGYLVRPPKSSARGASGSFKLGKEKDQQEKSHKKKSSSGKTAAKPKGEEEEKLPKAKAPKQKSKPKGAEQVKKKVSGTKPKAAPGDGGVTVSGAEPKAKASDEKAAKATKEQGVPKASRAKLASGPKKDPPKTKAAKEQGVTKASQAELASDPKKAAPKTKAELKGVPKAKAKSKLPQDEKAKGDAVPKGAIMKSRAASETKAAQAKGKPKAKKGAAGGQEKEESTSGSEA